MNKFNRRVEIPSPSGRAREEVLATTPPPGSGGSMPVSARSDRAPRGGGFEDGVTPAPRRPLQQDEISLSSASSRAGKRSQKCTSVRSVGFSEDANTRFRRTMEDAHVVLDGYGDMKTQGFFAVYDGHGGREAVEHVASELHRHLLRELSVNPEANAAEMLCRAYLTTDSELAQLNMTQVGTTAVTCLIREEGGQRMLYTANVGDSRAILCRNGAALRLTFDHRATDPGEADRVFNSGGLVANNRVNGVLAVTRALGDHAMKKPQPLVSAAPYTTEVELSPADTLLIIACDGVFDVMSDQEVVDLVKVESSPQIMSDKLVERSLELGSTDNITVMVLRL